MTCDPRRILSLLVPLVLVWSGQTARAQGEISLRRVAFIERDGPVLLEHIAELRGDEAIEFAELVVEPDPGARLGPSGRPFEIEVGRLRDRLGEREDVNWGRLILRGSTCLVRVRPESGEAPDADASAVLPETGDRIVRGTVKSRVVTTVASFLRVEREALRVRFRPGDRAFLAQAVGSRTVEVRPTGLSEDMGLRVTVYEGDRIVDSRLVRVGVEVRREVAVLRVEKRRGDPIGEADVLVESRWTVPGAGVLAPEEVIGQAAHTRIEPGEVVRARDVETPLAAKRGERVTVHCVNGPIVLRTEARAPRDVRDGEVVELETIDGKRTITARMSGERRAVAVVDAHPPRPERGKEGSG